MIDQVGNRIEVDRSTVQRAQPWGAAWGDLRVRHALRSGLRRSRGANQNVRCQIELEAVIVFDAETAPTNGDGPSQRAA